MTPKTIERQLREVAKAVFSSMLLLSLVCLVLSPPAISGTNDFFGGTMPGAQDPTATTPQAQAADAAQQNLPADYTDDEKRMQKRYKSSVSHAKSLIAKGERMMKGGEGGKNDKAYKKGKILKEIGEKRLAELQANNPLPEAEQSKKKRAASLSEETKVEAQ